MTRATLASLAALVLFSTLTYGQTRARYGIVLYDPPAGWARQEKEDFHILTSPDKNVALIFLPTKPLDTTLDKVADGILSESKARPEFREETGRTRGTHAAGDQWLSFTFSYADANRPGQYLYNWVVLDAAGGRYATLSIVATNPAALKTNASTLTRLVNGVTLTTTMQIEPGSPPLTRYLLDETEDFLEWLMQVPLTEAQKATIEGEIRGSWKKNDRKEIAGVEDVLKARQQLAAMKPAERDVARQTVLDDAIKQWRTEKDSPSAKLMVEIYEGAHKPIAAGNPPLTRQNVDAFAEFLCFAAGQTAGVNYTPPPEVRDQLAAGVAEKYASIAPAQQALIARMPLIWASLRALWPEISDAEKKQYIEAWKQDPHLVELGKQIYAASQTAPTTSASQTTAASQTASPTTIEELKAKMREQQFAYTTMSNIMRMQYVTSSNIIGNMTGGWHYEYRWH